MKASISENAEKLIKIFLKQENVRLYGKLKGRNKELKTVLHLAAGNCTKESASSILEEMLNHSDAKDPGFLNLKDNRGNTAFMEAAGSGNTKVVNLFLQKQSVKDHIQSDSLINSLHISSRYVSLAMHSFRYFEIYFKILYPKIISFV